MANREYQIGRPIRYSIPPNRYSLQEEEQGVRVRPDGHGLYPALGAKGPCSAVSDGRPTRGPRSRSCPEPEGTNSGGRAFHALMAAWLGQWSGPRLRPVPARDRTTPLHPPELVRRQTSVDPARLVGKDTPFLSAPSSALSRRRIGPICRAKSGDFSQ